MTSHADIVREALDYYFTPGEHPDGPNIEGHAALDALVAERDDALKGDKDAFYMAKYLAQKERAEAAEGRVAELETALHFYGDESPCPDCDGTRTVFLDDGIVEDCYCCDASGFVNAHGYDSGAVARAALAPKDET